MKNHKKTLNKRLNNFCLNIKKKQLKKINTSANVYQKFEIYFFQEQLRQILKLAFNLTNKLLNEKKNCLSGIYLTSSKQLNNAHEKFYIDTKAKIHMTKCEQNIRQQKNIFYQKIIK